MDTGSPTDVCKAHPTAAGCPGNTNSDTATNGDCPGPDICQGDAIECATLTEAHRARCADQKLFDDLNGTDGLTLGQSVIDGKDPLIGSFPTKANGDTVDMPDALDQSGFLGGGQCFPDKSIAGPFGQTYVIGFSALCDDLVPVRYGLMLVAGLLSIRIVAKAASS